MRPPRPRTGLRDNFRRSEMANTGKGSFLRPERLEQLEALLQEESSEAAQLRAEARFIAPPIVPVPRDSVLPLSFAQQRLWFLNQLEQGSTAYNIPMAIRLKGRLNVGALGQSLNEIVRGHEALRTTFATAEEEPVQAIA